jgi:hypothetical protein
MWIINWLEISGIALLSILGAIVFLLLVNFIEFLIDIIRITWHKNNDDDYDEEL